MGSQECYQEGNICMEKCCEIGQSLNQSLLCDERSILNYSCILCINSTLFNLYAGCWNSSLKRTIKVNLYLVSIRPMMLDTRRNTILLCQLNSLKTWSLGSSVVIVKELPCYILENGVLTRMVILTSFYLVKISLPNTTVWKIL